MFSINRRTIVFLFVAVTALTRVGADQLAQDQSAFLSTAAVNARSSGSPVGPPPKVTICHNGNTLSVAEAAVAAHLAHGDTLGPCQQTQAATPPAK